MKNIVATSILALAFAMSAAAQPGGPVFVLTNVGVASYGPGQTTPLPCQANVTYGCPTLFGDFQDAILTPPSTYLFVCTCSQTYWGVVLSNLGAPQTAVTVTIALSGPAPVTYTFSTELKFVYGTDGNGYGFFSVQELPPAASGAYQVGITVTMKNSPTTSSKASTRFKIQII